jgi:hypothetical protein
MFRRLKASPPRELAKWALYSLILFAPGSLAVLIFLWLLRLLRARVSRSTPKLQLPERTLQHYWSSRSKRQCDQTISFALLPLERPIDECPRLTQNRKHSKAPRSADAEPNLAGGAIDAISGAAG